jgi:hypothetical protein
MKKLLYTLVLVASLVACSDDDKNPVFAKESLYGTWEAEDDDKDGCKDAVKIDADKMYNGENCGSGASFGSGYSYTYSDNTIIVPDFNMPGFEVKSVVIGLTSTTLTIDSYLNGAKVDQSVYTKVK